MKMKATDNIMQNSTKNNRNAALDIRNANITDPRKYIHFPLLQNLQAEQNILQISKTLQQPLREAVQREKHLKWSKAQFLLKKYYLNLLPFSKNSVQDPSTTQCHPSPFSYHSVSDSQIRTATFSLFPWQGKLMQPGWRGALRYCICLNGLSPRRALGASTHFVLYKYITCCCPMYLIY